MIYRILLLLLTTTAFTTGDPVHISMSIRCSPTNSVYCGVLYVYEVDYGASHDVIKKEEFCVDPALYKKDFSWDYSGGDASPQYEITYQLSHNCTSKGVYRCINPEPVDVWVFGEQKVHFDLNAYENGTLSACLPMY